MLWIGLLVVCYLLGSVSFSYLIVRLLKGIDVRSIGSGNAGATNVMRATGKWPAVLALVLDVGKGAVAVAGARWLEAPPAVVAGAGVTAVLGHVLSVFLKFRGGKGVATAAGVLASLAPRPTLLAMGVFVVLVAWKRYISLGSVTAALLMPPLIYLGSLQGWVRPDELLWLLAGSVAIAVVVVVKHSENLKRLRQGTESKLGERVAMTEAES